MYSLIPFILIITTNMLLIYEIKKQTGNIKSASKDAKNKALNRLVIIMALLFIALTLPAAVVTIILNKVLQTSGVVGFVIINLCDCLAFSYHALNFMIVMLTNKRFMIEVTVFVRARLHMKPIKNANSSVNTTQTQTQSLKV